MDLGTVLLAALVGGGVLFVWGAIGWMVLPHHHGDNKNLGEKEGAVRDAIRAASPGAGWFIFPHYANYAQGMKDPRLQEEYRNGPTGVLLLRGGNSWMGPAVFARGILINFLVALGYATVLYLGGEKLAGVWTKVGYFACLAVLLEGGTAYLNSNWWGVPWRNAMTRVFDAVVGAALVGIAMHFVV